MTVVAHKQNMLWHQLQIKKKWHDDDIWSTALTKRKRTHGTVTCSRVPGIQMDPKLSHWFIRYGRIDMKSHLPSLQLVSLQLVSLQLLLPLELKTVTNLSEGSVPSCHLRVILNGVNCFPIWDQWSTLILLYYFVPPGWRKVTCPFPRSSMYSKLSTSPPPWLGLEKLSSRRSLILSFGRVERMLETLRVFLQVSRWICIIMTKTSLWMSQWMNEWMNGGFSSNAWIKKVLKSWSELWKNTIHRIANCQKVFDLKYLISIVR